MILSTQTRTLPVLAVVLLALFAVALVGCGLGQAEEAAGTPEPTPSATRAAATTAPIALIPTVEPIATVAPVTSLRVWIPPAIGSRTEPGAQELARQLDEFQVQHPDIQLIVEPKLVEGQGGILSYLRTGRDVAPAVLPDLVALPTSVLAGTGIQELTYPLETLIGPDPLADVYSAPAGQVVSNGRVYGYPFATLGLTHLAYRPSVITGTVPLQWSTFISETNHTMVFPADSRDGATLGLQFYLAEGGTLSNEAGQPALQVEPLTRALQQLGLRQENLLQSHQMKTLDEAWQYYQLGLSESVWTRTDYFLGQKALLSAADPALAEDQAYVAMPGPSGPLTPLITSWAWAITSPDPRRQALAADLIATLTEPTGLAAWSAENSVLPAQRAATAVLAESDPYFEFVSRQLERAQMMPANASSRMLDVLGDAVFQVLTTTKPPEVIAEEAVFALQQ